MRTKKNIHTLIPGVTGWAQINGRDELTIPVKVEFDAYYLKNRSLFLDAKIVFMTMLKVLKKEGVRH
jgi:O-antigen biosynthesis protein WbqP